jgi:hypothetical protein
LLPGNTTVSALLLLLQAGQFIGARADFVPEQICAKLCLLQDKVPPMTPQRAKQVGRWGDASAGSMH